MATESAHHETLYYSVREACRVTSLGKTHLYELIKNGLETRKIGKRTLIPAASLRALIEGTAE
ncbi:MAG: DNA-binding protein [Sphingobacteriales bacterium]|nr:MAG: DNA-binding protein [Sphingobacteriales bacterium]